MVQILMSIKPVMSTYDAILLSINAVVLLIPVFLIKDLEPERI